MTSEMIERAAKALAYNAGLLNWDAAFDREQDTFRAHARVVIEAMRDPTRAMSDAVYANFRKENIDWSEASSADVYRAMIDAALSEHDR